MTPPDPSHPPSFRPRALSPWWAGAAGAAGFAIVYTGLYPLVRPPWGLVAALFAAFAVAAAMAIFCVRAHWRRLAADLRASRERLSLAVEGAHQAIWDWDIATNQTSWSGPLTELVGGGVGGARAAGFDASRFVWSAHLHPNDRERAERALKAHLESGSHYDVEYRLRVMDGSYRWFRSVGRAVRDHAGRPVRMAGVMADIDARVVAQHRLTESEERFRAVFEKHPYPMWVFDRDSARFIGVNDAAVLKYGFTRDEFLGMTIYDIRPAHDRARLAEYLRVQDPAADSVGQWRHRTRAGRELDVVVSTSPVPWAPGRNTRLATVIDVTDKVASERLREEQNLILEMITGDAPLPAILERIVLAVQRHEPAALGSIVLLDADGQSLRTAAGPALPAEFSRAVDGLRIGPRVGSCGTAISTGRRVVVSDIATDPLWEDYRALALAHGLRACWSEPICGSRGDVLGSFAMYYREARSPTEWETQLISSAARLAGIAIERRRAEQTVKESEERYRSLVEGVRVITWEAGLPGSGFTFVSDHAEQILGYPPDAWYRPGFWPEHLHPDDRQRVLDSRRTQAALAQAYQSEYRMIGAGGGTVWLQDIVSVLTHDGRAVGLRGAMIDITERKRAEAELDRFYRLSPGLLCTADAGGFFKRINPAFVAALGYTEAELTSRPYLDYVHPDDRAATAAESARISAGGPASVFENRYRHADGAYRWVSWRAVKAADDGVIYAAARDITRERLAADALRQSEATKTALMHALPDIMFRMDAGGRYLDYSCPAGEPLLVAPEHFLGKTAAEVLPAPQSARCMEAIAAVLKTGEPSTYEYSVGAPPDTRQWEVRVVKVGDSMEALLLVRNVTSERRAQAALRDSQKRLSALVGQAPIGVIVWNTRFEFTQFNPACERMFGFGAAEVLGRSGEVIIPHEGRPAIDELWRALMARRGGAYSVNENLTRTGERIICEWHNTPLTGPGGEVIGVSSFVQDVTERVMSERRQAMMMQELDHRVKNNMAAVISLAEQTGSASADFDEFQATFMSRVRALARVHTILAASHWRETDLGTVAQQVIEPYSGAAPGRLVLEGPEVALPPRAAQSFAMTFNELATNAAKYGALSVPSGRITLRWSLDPAKPGSPVCLGVEWLEHGGPAVPTPSRRGLGMELIDGAIAFQLGGSVHFEFLPGGLRCKISACIASDPADPPSPPEADLRRALNRR